MAESGICGNFTETLFAVKKKLELQILAWNEEAAQRGEHKCFEHLTSRVKTERSMRDKLLRRGLEETTENALCRLTDAIAEEKDYIQNVKPSGYRSLHLILRCETDAPDFYGRVPGQFFVEVQIRTIAMDSWASLEHEMHYKREGGNRELIAAELKHVADDLASCDLSMQTIRNMIRKEEA